MRMTSRLTCLAASAALLLAGCGGGGSDTATTGTAPSPSPAPAPNPTAAALRPAKVARGVEEEIEVHSARCQPRPGGDGKHFRCHVEAGREPFILNVAVLEAQGAPVISSCEPGGQRQRPLETITCPYPGKAGGQPG
jgi:hypothetical protein